jgi:hypothetical protein
MEKYVLHEGQSDVKLDIQVDYENGSQMTLAELQASTSIKIKYLFKDIDDETNDVPGEWTATGVREDDGIPIVYYLFGKKLVEGVEVNEYVPYNCSRLLGRVEIIDAAGKKSIGRTFSVQVLKDEF